MARQNNFWQLLLASERISSHTREMPTMALKLMKIWTKIKLMQDLQDSNHNVEVVVVETVVTESVEVEAVMVTTVKDSIAIARKSLRVTHVMQEAVVTEETLLSHKRERSWMTTLNHSHLLSDRFNWVRKCLRFKQCSRSEIFVEEWIQHNFIKLN
jgi:hypothetical protein